MIKHLSLAVAYCAIVAAVAVWVHSNTLRSELAALQSAGGVRLNEATSRLRLQIDNYRALVNFVAGDVRMVEAMRTSVTEAATEELSTFALTYGAKRIDLTNDLGRVLVSSDAQMAGQVLTGPLINAARNHRLGFDIAHRDGLRQVRLARRSGAGGLVVVTVDLAALEFEWPVTPEPIVFLDAEGLSLSSNRPELLLQTRGGDPEETPLALTPAGDLAGVPTWHFLQADRTSLRVVVDRLYSPHLGLSGEIYLNTAPAQATARLRLLLVLAGAGVLGLIGAISVLQRQRLAQEARHSTELEHRVEERTQALQIAQGELVEASKLAALGRLSAGVSHELNQPLAAILNFAQNGQKFLERGAPEKVGQNLTLISDQVRRITRIIGNLRAFARQEAMPTEIIDFGKVTHAALDFLAPDITSLAVALETQIPRHAVRVNAGRVRLEQVVLNLVTNALDAMADRDLRRLEVSLTQREKTARLTIRDTGQGIKDPDKVFEPFYTTKNLGASQGLGLGLALSHGIVTRFGGTLSCRNLETGAEFQIDLPLAKEA